MEDAQERIYEPFPIESYDPKKLGSGLATVDRNDVIRLLNTPVLIRTINVTTGQGNGNTNASWAIPFDPNNSVGGVTPPPGLDQNMWLSRLNAFQGFRATTVIEFKLNANRFVQGRLMAYYIPGQNTADQRERNSHRFNLTTKTQLPESG